MFHSFDPAPFREKDLDPAAEEYLEEAVRDIGPSRPIRLRVHLPPDALAAEAARTLPDAIAHHFSYRAAQTGVDLRRLLGRGAVSLSIGLAFLVLCLWLRTPIAADPRYTVFAEGLLIIGWVGLWRPVEIFLYDWWPVRRRQRRFAVLARMPVEIAAGEP
jgi:hypothetical protein